AAVRRFLAVRLTLRHMACTISPDAEPCTMTSRTKEFGDVDGFRRLLAERELKSHSYAILLGMRKLDWPDILQTVERGFQFSALEHFLRNVSLPTEQALEWIQIAPRTLTRRKEQGQLMPDESDRLLR